MIFLLLIILILAGYNIAQPIVGHRASELVGFIDINIIPYDSLGSPKLQDHTMADPIVSADFADNAFTASKFPNDFINTLHIRDAGLTGGNLPSIPDSKIINVSWGQVNGTPDWDFGGINYREPVSSVSCDHPALPGFQTASPSTDGYVVYNGWVSVQLNWTDNNWSKCNATNSGAQVFKQECLQYWAGSMGLIGPPACDCSDTPIGVCP